MYQEKYWFKFIYFYLAVVLWLLVGMLVHWILEWPVLYYLTKDFYTYSLGLAYDSWVAIHNIFSFILLVTSALAGVYFGLKWYDYIYVQKHSR